MTANTFAQFAIFLILLLALSKPLGEYMGRVFERERTFLDPALRPLERFIYRLMVREAQQDFSVRLTEFSGTVSAGSGASFTLVADRKDGFEGDITCEISGVPEGWHVTTPLVIQAGHLEAKGCLTALAGAGAWTSPRITVHAQIGGKEVTRMAGLSSRLHG